MTALKDQLADAEKEGALRTESERVAAESRRLEREATEAARIAAAEERAQRVAGMTPEEMCKAEELINWDFIKERDQPQQLRDHLARFPKGVTTNNARAKLEELVWDGIALKNIFRDFGSLEDTKELVARLQPFSDEFPDGKYAEEPCAHRCSR